jgi:hypothetical protein
VRALPLRPDLQAATSSSYDPDGFLVVGVDGDATTTTLPPSEAHHPLGFCARPLDPGTDGAGNVNQALACNVLRLTGDNVDDVVLLADPRVVPKIPQGPKGSSCMYEPGFGPDLARITLNYDNAHGLVIHVAAGGPTVTIEVAGGPSITVDPTGVQLGAVGGLAVVVDRGLTAFLTALGTATGVGPPPVLGAIKVKAT